MAVANRPRKAAKKKPVPVAAKAASLPTIPLPLNMDPAFYRRALGWYHNNWDSILSDYSYQARLKEGHAYAGTFRVCARCRTQVDTVAQTLRCSCVQHINCGHWLDLQNYTQYTFGACKQPIHCKYCCTCVTCKTCKKLFSSKRRPSYSLTEEVRIVKGYDKTCGQCTACCRCQPCVNCGKSTPKNCACGVRTRWHHADCCDSDARIEASPRSLVFLHRKPIFHEGTNFQQNRIRRFLSVESEVANFKEAADLRPLNYFARRWGAGVVKDGTVPYGAEICTAPASGDRFLTQIKELSSLHTKTGSVTNIRTGMHVHVDARDFYYTDLVNLIHLYACLEPALFAMLPPWRRINRFCTPCESQLTAIAASGNKFIAAIRDPETAQYTKTVKAAASVWKPSIALQIAAKLYKTKTLKSVKKIHKSHDNQHIRYMALNLHSWVYRRTIEFRHFQGSTKEEDMVLWPQLMGAILDTAKRLPINAKRGQPCISRLPKNPVDCLLEILKPKSWLSQDLLSYAQRSIEQWSPDWSTIWPIMAKSKDTVVPFYKVSPIDGYYLSFDLDAMAYTYLNSRYLTWDTQWHNPIQYGGRYASTPDLIAVPDKGEVKWIAPTKKKPDPVPIPGPIPQPVYLATTQYPYDNIQVNRETYEQLHRMPEPQRAAVLSAIRLGYTFNANDTTPAPILNHDLHREEANLEEFNDF